MTFIPFENPSLRKRTFYPLHRLGTDPGRMLTCGTPELSLLHPLNMKLVSQETIDEGMVLMTQFKKRASTELLKELLDLEYAVLKVSAKKLSGR